ncbi:MAG: DUF1175 family protein [Terriglobales bacterium]
MSRYLSLQSWVVLLVGLLAGITIALAMHSHANSGELVVTVSHDILPADGYSRAWMHARNRNGSELREVRWQFESGRNLAEIERSTSGARVQAGVTPGEVLVIASAPGFKTSEVKIRLDLDPTDEFGDGTPDFLRLQSANDQIAFRRWFAFLAEYTYFEKEHDRPSEITDCAALIRFAYREALRRHDGPWASRWHLQSLPTVSSVQKYNYPNTALGADLFRIRAGAFLPEDIRSGAFAEFADAETLWRFNTHLVSRDLRAARAGDLLFFRQAGHRMPFHSMIYLGLGEFDGGNDAAWVLYHSGPAGKQPGEIRRVTIKDLLQHPQACWRPVRQNAAFLGVYRWNILREAD